LKYSNDTGVTWIDSSLIFPPDVETPTLASMQKGNFYVFISSTYQLLVLPFYETEKHGRSRAGRHQGGKGFDNLALPASEKKR